MSAYSGKVEADAPDQGSQMLPAGFGSEFPTPGQVERDASVSLIQIAAAAVRRWRLLVGVPVTVAAVVVAYTLLQPRQFAAKAALSSASNNSAGAAGLAAQLGFGLPGGDPTQSPEFVAQMIKSPATLRRVVDTDFAFVENGRERRAAFADIYEIQPGSPDLRREMAVLEMGRHLSVTTDPATGIIRLQFAAFSPQLALAVTQRILAMLDTVNLERRQATARAEREFTESRLVIAQAALRQAEGDLERFLKANRVYQDDPHLVVEHERLARQVDFRQQIATSLAQRAEQLGLDAARNTAMVTLLEAPILPQYPEGRHLAFRVAVSVLGSGLAVLLWITLVQLIDQARAGDPVSSRSLEAEMIALRARLPFRRGRVTTPVQ
jgi:uncharacterized protein involved in exopolysaccharide biosynthesis